MGSWTFEDFTSDVATYEEVYSKVLDLSEQKLSEYGFKRDIENEVVYLVKGENEIQVEFSKQSPINVFSWCGSIKGPVSELEELLDLKLKKFQQLTTH